MEVYRVFRLIDTVVDEAISQSFKSYVGERVKELEQLQQQATMANQEVTRLVRTSQDTLSQQLTDKLKAPSAPSLSTRPCFSVSKNKLQKRKIYRLESVTSNAYFKTADSFCV